MSKDTTITDTRWVNVTDRDTLIDLVRKEAKEIQKKKKSNLVINLVNLPKKTGHFNSDSELVLTDDFRYERRGDCELIRCTLQDCEKPNAHWHNNLVIFKYKDIILERNDVTGTKQFTKDGITAKIKSDEKFYKMEKGDPVGITFDYTDEAGVKRKMRIEGSDLEGCFQIWGYNDDPYTVIMAWEEEIQKNLNSVTYKKVQEKYPDGTYREYDDKERIVKEKLPDGTSTTWDYSDFIPQKRVTKDNETKIYEGFDDNLEYVGKVVEKDGNTYSYNAEGTLKEEIINLPTDVYYGKLCIGRTTKITYYDNGNKEMEEILSGAPGTTGNKTYYDPDNNGKVIAYTKGNGGLVFANNDDAARKAMKRRFEKAMETGNIHDATENLLLILSSLKPFGNPQEHYTDWSLLVRSELMKTKIQVLDDNKVAIGGMFEDRHWAGENYRGGGIEWYWKTAAAVVDLEGDGCGVVASCHTDRINVRDRWDPEDDLWNKLDDEFMVIDKETGNLTIGLKKDKEHGGKWAISETINLNDKIAEYDEFVASAKVQSQKISGKLQEYREKIEKHTEKPARSTKTVKKTTSRGKKSSRDDDLR